MHGVHTASEQAMLWGDAREQICTSLHVGTEPLSKRPKQLTEDDEAGVERQQH